MKTGLRILLVTEDLPVAQLGGAGQHAVVLGNALLQAGHHVELLGRRPEDDFQGDNGFAGRLHRLIDFRGARWRDISTGAFMPMARPHMARRLWRAIQQVPGPWDVVHYHGHNPHLAALVPAAVNFVHTLHDQGAECITKIRFRDGEACRATQARECASCAQRQPNLLQSWLSVQAVNGLRRASLAGFKRHKAIFVSEFLLQRYCQGVRVTPDAIQGHVVHNFVDLSKIRLALQAPDLPPRAAGGRRRVFGAGRIDRAKGFHALLDQVSDEQLSCLDIVIAGDGPGLAAAKAAHAHRGVTFLGWQSQAQVLAHVRAADVCVVPSVWDEPCATTVLEGLALGRTVLALTRGGTVELARYGQPGQLLVVDSLEKLASTLVAVPLKDWRLSDTMGVESRLEAIETVYRQSRDALALILAAGGCA